MTSTDDFIDQQHKLIERLKPNHNTMKSFLSPLHLTSMSLIFYLLYFLFPRPSCTHFNKNLYSILKGKKHRLKKLKQHQNQTLICKMLEILSQVYYSIETCILSYVKQIASPGLMHGTGRSGRCTGMTLRDGKHMYTHG